MSLNSKERSFFESFENGFQNLPELSWQISKSYSTDLLVNENLSEGGWDVFEAEAYYLSKVIKVSDPILSSKEISINSRYQIYKVRLYRDANQNSIVIYYPTDNQEEININTPSIFLYDDLTVQGHWVRKEHKTTQEFCGIYQGLYKGKIGRSYSPTIRSISNESVRSFRRVQVSIQDPEEFLFGFNYYPFPRSDVNKDRNQSTPKTIAYGLYFLSSRKEDQKIIGLLNNIADYYIDTVKAEKTKLGYQAKSDKVPGFPKNLFRWYRGIDSNVSIEDNLFLGLAITDSLLYLYNREKSKQIKLNGLLDLEGKLSFVLDQIVFLLRSVSNNGKVFPSSILDKEGYASNDSSLVCAYLGSLFITHSLQINYTLENHTLASNFYQLLAYLPLISPRDFQNINVEDKSSFKADFAQILWLLYFGINNPNIEEELANRIEFLEISDLSSVFQESVFFLGFYQALFPELSYPNGDLLSNRPFTQAPTKEQGEDLYSVDLNSPSLIDQCYGGFIDTEYLFFRQIDPFPILSEEANLILTKFHTEQMRVLPKGKEWFSQEALNSRSSVISSLLLSSSKSFHSSVLRYLLESLGSNPLQAVGFVLEEYNQIYQGKERFQGDTYWNKLLNLYLTTDNTKKDSIEETAKRIVDSTYYIVPPKPYFYKTKNEDGNIVEAVFDPNKDSSLIEITSQGGIKELIDLESSLTLSDIDLLSADSDEFLWDFLDQPIYEEEGSLGNPYITIPSDRLVGYIESKGSSSKATGIVKDLIPAGLHYRKAIINLSFKFVRNRSRICKFNITEVN